MKLTACIRLSASSKHICLLYVLMTDCPLLQIFVMHSRSGAEKEGITTATYLLTVLTSEPPVMNRLALLYGLVGDCAVSEATVQQRVADCS